MRRNLLLSKWRRYHQQPATSKMEGLGEQLRAGPPNLVDDRIHRTTA
jgi:hypothetical protein